MSSPPRTAALRARPLVGALAAGLLVAAGSVRAQPPASPPQPVLPLSEVLHDADGDGIPERDGQEVTTGGRVITGVMGQEDGWKDFFIQSGSTGIDVVIPEGMGVPAPGDSILATGIVVFEGGMMLLVESVYEVAAVPPFVPVPVPLAEPDTEVLLAHRGRLVTMEGTMVGTSRAHGGLSLLLYPDGGDAINVFVSSNRLSAFDLDALAPGTRLRVTGVLGQYDEEAPYDEGFILYPRAQADLRRVGLSAAFYQRALLGGVLLVLLAAAWAATLRRQVRRKTAALYESKAALQRELAQRKEAEEVLRRYVLRLDEAQRIAGLGYWEWDADLNVTDFSDEAVRHFGYEPGTIRPSLEWFLSHTTPDEAKRFVRVIRNARPGVPSEVEYRVTRADGAVRTLFGSVVILGEHDGVPTRIFGVCVDVTERKRYEQALVQAIEQAEAARRSAEEARRRAEEMLRLKSAFLNNMSHEIRTPLTGIIGYADVLAEEVAEEHRAFVDVIIRSGRRLSETLNSVLDLAQLDGGTVHLDARPVEVLDEADEALALLRPLAEEKGLTVALRGTPAFALADRKALHRILTNLVGNAVKFTAEGGVTVEVGAEAAAVRLRVSDTGCGIAPAFLPHLFDEFQQESDGYTRKHEGNGLGLAITKRLLDLMGGQIAVESTPGEGSTFTVLLPPGAPGAEGRHPEAPARLVPEGAPVAEGAMPEWLD